MALSKTAVARSAARQLTSTQVEAVTDLYLAWVASKADQDKALDALSGASETSKRPSAVLANADALYAAAPDPHPGSLDTIDELAAAVAGLPATFAAKDADRATALATWWAALANRATVPANVLIIGDSIAEGSNAGSNPMRFVSRLREILRNRYRTIGVPGGEGFIPANSISSAGSFWTAAGTLGTAPSTPTTFGLAGLARRFSYDGTYSLTTTVTASKVTLCLGVNNTTQPVKVTIDAGTPTEYPTATGSATVTMAYQDIALGAAGVSHTIKIERGTPTGTGSMYFAGMFVYNGDETAGIRVFNGGHAGWKASDWVNRTRAVPGEGASVAADWAKVAPSLVIIEVGTNDAANVSSAVFKANVQNLIADVRAATGAPSIVLTGIYTREDIALIEPAINYNKALADIAAADTAITFYNVIGRFPSRQSLDAWGRIDATDKTHPTAKGHEDLAFALGDFLSPDDWPH